MPGGHEVHGDAGERIEVAIGRDGGEEQLRERASIKTASLLTDHNQSSADEAKAHR